MQSEVSVNVAEGGKTLVIVESATKAKKIQKYLGDDFIVEASVCLLYTSDAADE